jgi:hypothetical protein
MSTLVIFESPMILSMALAKLGNSDFTAIFLKHEEQNHFDDNGRQVEEQFKICLAIAENFKFEINVMNVGEALLEISNKEFNQIFIELKFLHNIKVLKNKILNNTKTRIIGITYAMDYLLANGSYFKNIFNFYRIQNIYLWRKLLKDIQVSEFIFSNLSTPPKKLSNKRVDIVSIKEWELFLNVPRRGSFCSQLGIPDFIAHGNSVYLNLPFMDRKWLEQNIENYLILIKHEAKYRGKLIIIKPHPGILFDRELAQEYISEKCFDLGLEVVFMFSNLESALPIEILLGLSPNNLFVGVPTGGVAFMKSENVQFISSGDKIYDKNTRLGYYEFLRRR